jgi:hypothetical protein
MYLLSCPRAWQLHRIDSLHPQIYPLLNVTTKERPVYCQGVATKCFMCFTPKWLNLNHPVGPVCNRLRQCFRTGRDSFRFSPAIRRLQPVTETASLNNFAVVPLTFLQYDRPRSAPATARSVGGIARYLASSERSEST